jgi:hypothetical protein
MREIRLSGSEGGAVYPVPTPILEPKPIACTAGASGLVPPQRS